MPWGPRWAPHSRRGGPVSCSNLGHSSPCCFQGSALPPSRPHLHPKPTAASGFLGQEMGILPRPRTGAPGGSALAGTPWVTDERSLPAAGTGHANQPTPGGSHVVFLRGGNYTETRQKRPERACIKHSQARARPRDGQEPGRPRAPAAGAAYIQRAGQDPRGPGRAWAGAVGPSTVMRGAPTLCAPRFQPHWQPLDTTCPRGPEGRPGGQTIRCRPAGCLEPPTWAWAWTRCAALWES